jgi:hypothetical protein
MLTRRAITDRPSLAELAESNRAYAWLMLKLALAAIALVGAGLGLTLLG